MIAIVEYEVEIIDSIEYKLYINDFGPAVRVFDVDAQEVVTIVNYPDLKRAQDAYDAATKHAKEII